MNRVTVIKVMVITLYVTAAALNVTFKRGFLYRVTLVIWSRFVYVRSRYVK